MNRSVSSRAASARLALVAVIAVTLRVPPARARAETLATRSPSRRLERPLSVSGAANFPIFNLGLDVSYQLTDRFAIGGQLTSTFLVHNDLSARARLFLFARAKLGVYVGANLHGINSPILLSTPAAAGTWSWVWSSGPRGAGSWGSVLAGGYLWAEDAEGRGPDESNWMLWPAVNLRIGRAHTPLQGERRCKSTGTCWKHDPPHGRHPRRVACWA
jgi:hypothetical protein